MTSGVFSLVRRGLEFSNATLSDSPHRGELEIPKVSWPASLLVLFTALIFVVLYLSAQYCYGAVVGTLTMIESNQSDAYLAVDTLPSNDEDVDDMLKPSSDPLLEPETQLMQNTPITSSIRRTIMHLRARYGYLSRFRGLHVFICIMFARSFIVQFFAIPPFMRNWVGLSISSVLADVILSRWFMTWIHIVISEPTKQRWWKRALPIKSWTKIAPAVALASVSSQIALVLPMLVAMSFGAFRRMGNPDFVPTRRDLNAACAQSLFVLVLGIVLAVVIQLPTSVVLVRVAASMLPEENETVVPFDRSFGGKVTPAIIGGQGKIGMVEAWRSFDWAARIRLVKLMGKIVAIMIALWVLVIAVTIGEAHLIIGPKNMKLIYGILSDKLNGRH